MCGTICLIAPPSAEPAGFLLHRALIVVSTIVNDLRNPEVRIFLSYIFLFWFCQQENVGEENKSGRFLKSSADG
jgi:hypothetical protein